MEKYYSIAGSVIRVNTAQEKNINMFRGFECDSVETPLLTLEIENDTPVTDAYGVRYMKYPALSFGVSHILEETGEGKSRLFANEDWSEQKLFGGNGFEMSWMELLASAFYSRVSLFGGLLMHASAVEYKGQAVVFTAPSGTGKTTQAELWNKYADAKILNGDKVFFRSDKGRMYAWGSPWKGSSPYAVNECAPVKAIVVLSQGSENILTGLNGLDASLSFIPHVFLPSWDKHCTECALSTLDILAENTEIYSLSCRPDEESVNITKKVIFGE